MTITELLCYGVIGFSSGYMGGYVFNWVMKVTSK